MCSLPKSCYSYALRVTSAAPKMNLRLLQAVRNESVFTGRPTHGTKRSRTVYPLVVPATAPTRFYQERLKHTNRMFSRSIRDFTTSPDTSSRTIILSKFNKFLLAICLVLGVIAVIVSEGEKLYLSCLPQLPEWPEELRKHLVDARLALEKGSKGMVAPRLESAWKIIQDIPKDGLSRDLLVKLLSVAEWFADALDKEKEFSKAYDVLKEAVSLCQSRSQTLSSEPASEEANADSTKLAVKLHLISLFSKLACLSGKCEPEAEGRWLSLAILEILPLLPSCEVDIKSLREAISDAQELATFDASFSGLSNSLDTQVEASAGASSLGGEERRIDSESDITDEDARNDNSLPLPRWYLPDVPSAVAVTLEMAGLYAEKHGQTKIASSEYAAASSVLMPVPEPLDQEQSSNVSVERLLRLLRIMNRRIDLQLRLLESDTNPTKWLYRLHNITSEDWTATNLTGRIVELLNTNDGKIWPRMTMRKAETISEFKLEQSIVMRHTGMRMEKLGELALATRNFQSSFTLLQLAKSEKIKGKLQKLAAEYMKPAIDEEDRKLEACIRALKQSEEQGKDTIKSHMNPTALKEWERMKAARSRKAEPTGSAIQA